VSINFCESIVHPDWRCSIATSWLRTLIAHGHRPSCRPQRRCRALLAGKSRKQDRVERAASFRSNTEPVRDNPKAAFMQERSKLVERILEAHWSSFDATMAKGVTKLSGGAGARHLPALYTKSEQRLFVEMCFAIAKGDIGIDELGAVAVVCDVTERVERGRAAKTVVLSTLADGGLHCVRHLLRCARCKQESPSERMECIIRDLGRVPRQRDTVYRERRTVASLASPLPSHDANLATVLS
jgi:hypothetical protein